MPLGKMISCPLTRERQIVEFVAQLLIKLIESGMDEDTHYREVIDPIAVDIGGDWYVIDPPTPTEIKSVRLEGLSLRLEDLILPLLEEISDDLAQENKLKDYHNK